MLKSFRQYCKEDIDVNPMSVTPDLAPDAVTPDVQTPASPAPDAAPQAEQSKWDEYREAIQEEFGFDIDQYKDKLSGGKGDAKALTDFPLEQVLKGIKVEMEHTDDVATALEITTDHLTEKEDYYNEPLFSDDLKGTELEAKLGTEGEE